MNAAEKNVLHIALALFVVGLVVRILPWGIPAIEQQDDPVKLEYWNAKVEPLPDSLSVTDKLNSALAESPRADAHPRPQKQKKSKKKVHLPIKINSVGLDEICALKGVGPKLAAKIIAFREQNGPFLTPQDLQKVPGIGKKKLEGILQGVIFD